MVRPKRSALASFKAALSGLVYAFRSQPNLKRGLFFATFAFILSFLFHLSWLESVLIIWTIVIFFVAEMVNTSIEAVIDLLSEEWNMKAKIAKDIASGMVLLTAIATAVVGLLIFVPHLVGLFV